MLAIAAEHQIKPWIQELPMSRAKEAVESLWNGTVRYRFVLSPFEFPCPPFSQ